MTEMVLTKKTFIGHGAAGHLAYPGETVDVDEKGVPVAAGSTPIGNMTDAMLEAELERRRKASGEAGKPAPDFGGNVEEASDTNSGTQRLEVAPFRPGRGTRPQGIPPGTEEHNNTFLRPVADDVEAAVEVVLGAGADAALTDDGETATGSPEQRAADGSAFDHDGDGKTGGAPKGGNRKKK